MTTPGETPPANVPPEPSALPPKSPFYKRIDFWVGFIGWWAVNGPFYWWLTKGGQFIENAILGSLFVLPVTTIVLLIAAFKRRYFAGGLLVAIAINFIPALFLGTIGNALCGVPFFIHYP